MRRVTGRVQEERACPLYHRGDALEFAHPAVQGVEFAPVCVKAVRMLASDVEALRGGEDPAGHQRVFCGGCENGKAWFDFTVEDGLTAQRVTPEFAEFARDALRKMKLFAGARPNLLERLLPLLRERRVTDGEVVIARGDAARGLFIIVMGNFAVVNKDEQGIEHRLAGLGPGDCFGEMSLITGEPASATVRGEGEGCVLEVGIDDFPRLLSLMPSMSMTLARILANRLARSSSHVIDELRRGIIGRLDLVSPVELVQAMNVSNQTGIITVQGEREPASIHLSNGQVIDVQIGARRGEEAFYEFLEWRRGTFRFRPGLDNVERTIPVDTVVLLLEGLRRIDEAKETARRGQNALPLA